MNTAQALVELLKEYGVEYIFGVPGDTTMPLYDALYAARGEITHHGARRAFGGVYGRCLCPSGVQTGHH